MKYSSTVVLFVLLVLAAACKKDDTDTTLPYLNGMALDATLDGKDIPAFLGQGAKPTVYANILSVVGQTDEKPVIGLYWKLNSETADTLKNADGSVLYIDLSDPDLEEKYKDNELLRFKQRNAEGGHIDWVITEDGEYTLYCYAFSEGYYASGAGIVFDAVNPETVVSELEGDTTVRLGDQSYFTLSAGGATWLGNNLYDPSKGVSYRNSPVLDEGMGRLYSWSEAQTLCPAGWHLPTEVEFRSAFGDAEGYIHAGDLIVNALFQGEEMWVYNAQVSFLNTFQFNAVPAGYVDKNDPINTWNHYGHYALYWTADENDGLGTYLYIYEKEPEVRKAYGDKEMLYLSVRCVED